MGLAKKLLNVMKACRSLSYDSDNEEVGYKYVSAAKVNAAVNTALVENELVCIAAVKNVEVKQVETASGVKENFATLEVEINIFDVDTADEKDAACFVIRGAGSGIDAGDKAIAKAQTMAVKYAWKNTLLIADKSDDPDANQEARAYEQVKAQYEKIGAQKHPSFIAKVASDNLKNLKAPF